MRDPFDLFIDDSVYAVSNDYYNLMYKTKLLFFEYLDKGKSLEEFKKANDKIWDKVDHSFMKQRQQELDNMIKQRDLQGRQIINPKARYKQVYEIASIRKYKSVEDKFKKVIERYYKVKLKTVNKDYISKSHYLSQGVEVYDKIQQTIPYYNKDGSIHSYHNIASYNSMLYNSSLTHTGWNRTEYDSKLLDNEFYYLPAHTFACPMCQEWQGKLYSNNGTYGVKDGMKYQPKENAIRGGIGHPNCRHQWTLYWDKDQIQDETYDSAKWTDKYVIKQKERALDRTLDNLANDKEIYKKLGNQEKVENVEQKMKKINEKKEELHG